MLIVVRIISNNACLTKVIIHNVDSSMSTFRVPINNINSNIISNNILLTKVIIYNVDSSVSTFRVLNSNATINIILLILV